MPQFADGASLAYVREILNATGIRKCYYDAPRAPGPNDDETGLWEVGCFWYFEEEQYVCTLATAGAARWTNIRGTGTYDIWAQENPGGTYEEFLADMQVDPSPEMEALLDQTQEAAGAAALSAQAAEDIALGLSGTVVTVYQNQDDSWPARPPYPEYNAVRAVGWTPPPDGWMLTLGDEYIFRTKQYAPLAPTPESWVLNSMHNGTHAALTILSIAEMTPPINAVRYTADGGVPVIIPVPLPLTAPYTVEIPLSAALHGLTINTRNSVDWGTESAVKTVTVSAAPFTDDFNRVDGWVSAAPGLWRDVTIGISARRMNILGGKAGPQGANETYTVQCPDYLPLRQRIAVDVDALITSNASNPRGLALMLRMPRYDVPMDSGSYTQITGYIARQTAINWEILKRLTPGGAETQLPGAAGSGVFPVDVPDLWDFRITEGGLITLSYNGVQLWTGTDADNISGHYAGFRANTTSASGPTALRIDNAVVAGTF